MDRLRPELASARGPVRLDQPELVPERAQVLEQQERTDRLRLVVPVSAEREQLDQLGLARGPEPEQALGPPEQMDLLQREALVSAELASEPDQRASVQPERTDQLPLAEQVSAEPALELDQQASARPGQMDRLQLAELVSAGPASELDRLVLAEPDQRELGQPVSAGPAWELGPLVSAELARLEPGQQVSAEPDPPASAERVQRVLVPPVSAELALGLDRLA